MEKKITDESDKTIGRLTLDEKTAAIIKADPTRYSIGVECMGRVSADGVWSDVTIFSFVLIDKKKYLNEETMDG